MRKAPAALSANPDLPFKYIGGDASLDLVNTVDWAEGGLVDERLTDYERLTRWAEGAGIVAARDAKRLRQVAAARLDGARAAWDSARWLRYVLQRVFTDVATGERPGASLDDFNDLLAGALRRLHVAPAGRGSPAVAEWDWQGRGESLESLLDPVLWAAATLLTSEEARRVRVCAAPGCGWMYVDRSRNGLRRWCQMQSCGTREKSRRRSDRLASPPRRPESKKGKPG